MNRFESFLAQQFEDYMTYRQQLGYDTDNLRWALKTVDRYLVTQNAGPTDLTPAFFLSLQADLHTQNKSINRLLCCTRKLFEYLVRIEYCQDNPLRDIPWLPDPKRTISPLSSLQLKSTACLTPSVAACAKPQNIFSKIWAAIWPFYFWHAAGCVFTNRCGLSGITSVLTTKRFILKRPSLKKIV
jgi:hypothetical protein